MKNKELIFDNCSTGKLMLKLCIPVIIAMLINILYNLADTFFIGQLNDPLLVSALSIAAPIFSFTQSFNLLIGGGAAVMLGIALGKKEYDKIKSVSSFATYTSFTVGLLIGIIINVIPYQIARLLGATDSFIEHTVTYIRILGISAPFMVSSGVFSNIIRCDGSTLKATILSGSGTIVNMILDPILILLFKFEIAGAAIATLLGYLVSFILCLIYILRKRDLFSINIKHFSFSKDIGLTCLYLGIPQALATLLSTFVGTLVNNYLVSYGEIVIAANSIAHKSSYIILMIVMGISMGMQPAISYYFGQKNIKKMNKIILYTGIVSLFIGTLLTVGIYFFRNDFIRIFIKNDEVLQYGEIIVTVSLVTCPILGLYQVGISFLQATGKVTYATLCSILRQGLIFIPALIVLNSLFGFYGCIWAGQVANILSIALCFFFCFRSYKQIKKQAIAQ